MIEIINLEKLDNDGRKQPANDPTLSTPDNITHCQLRYNTFTSSYFIQGVAVTGASSTFEFTVSDALFYWKFKLYTSTDGTNYTEKKSYGGSAGKHLFDSSPRRMIIKVQQQGTDAPTLVSTKFNNTGKLVTTLVRIAAGQYRINIDNTDTNLFFRLSPVIGFAGTFQGFLAQALAR
ncbi:MAG: hypothetical protein IPG78_15190 [Ignavibacteria bacterium]|nr:hypothetical protein [Ignavibacteria bacterium]